MALREQKIAAYAALYLVWGSTYLAMRIGLETLPAYQMASARFLTAGAILFAAALARRATVPTAGEWGRAAVVALFLLVGGNTAVLWALKRVPSGVAALLVATTPLWLTILSRQRPTKRTAAGIALGLLGIVVLAGPDAFAGAGRIDLLGLVVLMFGSLSWAAGSLIQRAGGHPSALAATGMQMLCGGAMLAVIALVAGQTTIDVAHASARSLLALVYLTVLGSLVGFTCYAWLMRHDEPARVATYAYVNPIVAVILGTTLGGEAFTPRIAVAAAVIIAGVIAILRK